MVEMEEKGKSDWIPHLRVSLGRTLSLLPLRLALLARPSNTYVELFGLP